MATRTIRSRILEFFPKECLLDIYQICMSKKIKDNNSKVDAVIACLEKYKIDYVELGPGTNRFAILIDGYVFKIALDKWGIQDNINELTVSEELQPYVSKTYECNDLILVAEYVTVISREEFTKKRPHIEKILAIISEGYLLGDVGIVPKNFCNWGYRDTGELVILDYAYIYRIIGDEMFCNVEINEKTGERCGGMLSYDDNFDGLYCPRCRTKYSFVDVRRKISVEHEKHENNIAKQLAYEVIKPLTEFNAKEEENTSLNINENHEEDQTMGKKKYFEDYLNEEDVVDEKSDEEYLLDALSLMRDDEDVNEQEEVISEMIQDITIEQVTNTAKKIISESDEFDKFTDEIDEIKQVTETEVTVVNDNTIAVSSTTETVITHQPESSLIINFDDDITDEEIEELSDEDAKKLSDELGIKLDPDNGNTNESTVVYEDPDQQIEQDNPMASAFKAAGIDSTQYMTDDEINTPKSEISITKTTSFKYTGAIEMDDIDALRNELAQDLE